MLRTAPLATTTQNASHRLAWPHDDLQSWNRSHRFEKRTSMFSSQKKIYDPHMHNIFLFLGPTTYLFDPQAALLLRI